MVETRQRIVDAATALHAERGVLATSWEDIADEAGVAPATVYRHFPSLAEIIPACAKAVFDIARPPTLEEAHQKFADAAGVGDRFAVLVRDSCHCYARGEAWLHAARRERDLIPAIDDVVRIQEEGLAVLVAACLGDREVSRTASQLLLVFCDFPFWKQLSDRGASRRAIPDTVIGLIRSVLESEGIS
ncbi:MAG: TetR/AcrR family transcriptional regulator [Actinobacteria bacterium]|nr:TetR/AcrR family transcriptional regulator [Actinomycetota bacterium]